MINIFQKNARGLFFKIIHYAIAVCFLSNLILPGPGYAQVLSAPANHLVALSPAFTPVILRGIKVYSDNPLKFDFIVDGGNTGLKGEALKPESEKLIKYFLASLTVPQDDLWVNLSPYEKDRIIPSALSQTDMGKDMLAQDYLLKQITASLIYPEGDTGKKFWEKIYKKAYEQFGTTNIPIDTFNKVWIMPEKAVVYEQEDKAFVVESRLKVMLEEDYLAMEKAHSSSLIVHSKTNELSATNHELTSRIVREVILPELENEVNNGKNFAQLRQIYNALILAYWFKAKLKSSIVNKVYADKNKVKGIEISGSGLGARDSNNEIRDAIHDSRFTNEASHVDQIYNQYLNSFKQGVMNFIKVEHDQYTNKNIPRKYFAGGVIWDLTGKTEFQKGARAGSPILRSLQKAVSILALTVVLTVGAKQANAQVAALDQPVPIITEKVENPPDSILAQVQTVSPTVDSVYQLSDEDFLNKKNVDPFVIDSVLATKKFESSQLSNGLANKKTKGRTMRAFIRLLNDFYTQWNDGILKDPGASKQAYPKKETDTLTSFINLPLFNETSHSKIRLYYEIINQNLKAKGYLLGLGEIRSLNEKEVPFFSLWQITKTVQQNGQNIYYVKNDLLSNPEALWSSGAGVTPAGDLFVVTSVLDELARGIYSKHSSGAPLDDLDEIQFGSLFSYFPETFVLTVTKMFSEEFLLHELQHVDDINQEGKGKDFSVSPFNNELWGLLTKGYPGLSSADTLDASSVRLTNLELRAFLRMFINGKLLFWDLKSIASFFNYKFSLDGVVREKNKPKEQYQEVGRFLFPLFVRFLSSGDNAPLKPYVPGTKNQTVFTYLKKVQASFSDLKENDIRNAALVITYLFARDMLSAQEVIDAKSLIKENPKWLEIVKEGGIDPNAVKKDPQESPQEDKIPSGERATKGSSSSTLLTSGPAKPMTNEDAKQLSWKIARELNLSLFAWIDSYRLFDPDQEVVDWYGYTYKGEELSREDGFKVSPNGNGRQLEVRYAYVRIGHLFFFDINEYKKLAVETKQALGSNVILLNDLGDTEILKKGHQYYDTAIILTMMQKEFIGRDVIDSGAGQGILSLVALKLGAEYVDLFEMEHHALENAETHLRLNGYVAKKDYSFHSGNIEREDFLKEESKEIDKNRLEKSNSVTLITNIGFWPMLYNVSNKNSMNMIPLIPRIDAVIAGGITIKSPEENKVFLANDQSALKRSGFVVDKDVVMIKGSSISPTWTATRQLTSSSTLAADDVIEKRVQLINEKESRLLLRERYISFLKDTDPGTVEALSEEVAADSSKVAIEPFSPEDFNEVKNDILAIIFEEFFATWGSIGQKDFLEFWEMKQRGVEKAFRSTASVVYLAKIKNGGKDGRDKIVGYIRGNPLSSYRFAQLCAKNDKKFLRSPVFRELFLRKKFYLHAAYVLEKYRGQGVGLFKNIYDDIRARGYQYFVTLTANKKVSHFYEKVGTKLFQAQGDDYFAIEITPQLLSNNNGNANTAGKQTSSALVINNVPKDLEIPVGPIVTGIEEAMDHKASIVTINGTRLRIVNDSDRRSLYNHNLDIFVNEGVLIVNFPDAEGEIKIWATRSAKNSTLTVNAQRAATNQTDDVTESFKQEMYNLLNKIVSSKENKSSSSAIPSHWKESWKMPAKFYQELAEDFLREKILERPAFSREGLREVPDIFGLCHLPSLYFKYPNIASALFLSISWSSHGLWADALNPSRDKSDENLLPSAMIAAMISRALEIYRNNGEASFEKEDFYLDFTDKSKQRLERLGSFLLEYLPVERTVAIAKNIDSQSQDLFIKSLLWYFETLNSDWRAGRKANLANILFKIPSKRLAEVAAKLSDAERYDLEDITGRNFSGDEKKDGTSSSITLPPHWDARWPVPDEKYLSEADKFFNEDWGGGASELGRDFTIHAFGRFLSPIEHVEFLKACYFKHPQLTGLFFPTSYGSHETWENILNLNFVESDEAFIPSDMIAAMLNQAIEICKNKGQPQIEGKNVYFIPNQENIQVLARFFRIFPKWRSTAVLSSIKDENLGLLISGMLDFIYNSYTESASGQEGVRNVIREMPLERLNKAAAQLNKQDRIALQSLTGRKFSSSAIVLPSHWDKAWGPAPDESLKDGMLRALSYISGVSRSSFSQIFVGGGNLFYRSPEDFVAFYYYYPDVAAGLIMNVQSGNHGDLATYFYGEPHLSEDEKALKPKMVGWMLNRVLDPAFRDLNFSVPGGYKDSEKIEVDTNYNPYIFLEALAYLGHHPEFLNKVFSKLDDKKLAFALSWFVDYLKQTYQDQDRLDDCREFLLQVPNEKIQSVNKYLSENARTFFTANDKLTEQAPPESPEYWGKYWPVPSAIQLEWADKILGEALSGKGYFSDKIAKAFKDHKEELQNEKGLESANILQALYFKYPNITASIFVMRMSHGPWKTILNPSFTENDEGLIRSDIIASMMNRALEIYQDRDSKAIKFEKDDFSLDFETYPPLEQIGGLFGYFPQVRSLAITTHIKDENLPILISGMLMYLFDAGIAFVPDDTKEKIKRVVLQIGNDRLQKAAGKLSKDDRKKLEEVTGQKFVDVPTTDKLPSHWSEKWPVPTDKERRVAEEILKRDLLDKDFPGTAFVDKTKNDPYFAGEAAKILRALYFAYPNITSTLFLSFHRGNHGRWQEILNPSSIASEEDRIESTLLASMFNRALEIYRLGKAPVFEHDGYRYLKTDLNALADLGGLLGYFSEKRSLAIVINISDENLSDLVMGLLQFAFSRGSQFDESKDRAKNIIRSLSKDRLAKVNLKYSEDRARLKEVVEGTTNAPAKLPAHWDAKWPVPEQKYLDGVDKLFVGVRSISKQPGGALGVLANVQNKVNQVMLSNILPGAKGSFTLNDVRELLKASYFKYPKMTASFFVTVGGTHGDWKDILNPGDDKSDEDLIPSAMIASIMNQALDIYQSDIDREERDWSELENIAPEVRDLDDLGPFFGYLPVARSLAITEKISDENLGMLIGVVVNFIIGGNLIGRSNFNENVDHAKKFISQIPFDRLQKAAAKLSDADRKELEEITGKEFNEALEENAGAGSEILGLDGKPLGQEFLKELEDFISVYLPLDHGTEGVIVGDNFVNYMKIEIGVKSALGKLGKDGTFWALYETHPDIAAAALASFTMEHGEWRNILYPEMPNVEKEREYAIKVAKLFDQALTLVRTKPEFSINKKPRDIVYTFRGVMGLIGYDTEYANDDEVLDLLIKNLSPENIDVFLEEANDLIKYKWDLEIKDDMIVRIQKAIDGVLAKEAPAKDKVALLDHWNKKWKIPTDEEIKIADEILTEVIDRRSSDRFADWSLTIGHKIPCEPADVLRALYFKYPNITASFFITSSHHGYWAYVLNPRNQKKLKGLIESDLVASMMNRAFEMREKYKKSEEIVLEKKDIYLSRADLSQEGILGLVFSYLPENQAFKIISYIKEENLPVIVAMLQKYYDEFAGMAYQETKYRAEDLIKKMTPMLEGKKPVDLPAHWQKDWPVPTPEFRAKAYGLLKELLDDPNFPDDGFDLKNSKAQGEFAKILQALYFQYPAIAASLFLSIKEAHHGSWRTELNPSIGGNVKSDEDLIPSSMLAAMIDKATEIYLKDGKVEFEHKDFHITPSFHGLMNLSSLFRYLGEARNNAVVRHLDEKTIKFFASPKGMPKGFLVEVAESIGRVKDVEADVSLPVQPLVGWNSEWGVPETTRDEIVQDLLEEGRLATSRLPPTVSVRAFVDRDVEYFRAIYYYFPDAAARILGNIESGQHGAMAEYLLHYEVTGQMFGWMLNRVLDPDFQQQDLMIRVSPDKEVEFTLAAGWGDPLIDILAYRASNEELLNEVFAQLQGDRLARGLSLVVDYLEANKVMWERVKNYEKFLNSFPAEKIQAVQGALSSEALKFFTDNGKVKEAPVEIPAHWDAKWPKPKQTKIAINDILQERAERDINLNAVLMRQIPGAYIDHGDFRAIYYYYPDIATVIVLSFNFNHGDLAQYFNEFPKDFSAQMAGWMINRALDPEFQRLDLRVQGSDGKEADIYGRRGAVSFLTQTLSYFTHNADFMNKVFSRIEEKNRGKALSLMVENLDGLVALGNNSLIKDVKDFLLQFPSEKIEEVRDQLSPDALSFFISYGKISREAPSASISGLNEQTTAALKNFINSLSSDAKVSKGRIRLEERVRKFLEKEAPKDPAFKGVNASQIFWGLYDLRPDLAVAILASFEDNHGLWRDILWGGGDYLIAKEAQPAQAKRTAKLINDVLTFQRNDTAIEMNGVPRQVYFLFKATNADEDQEGFSEILAYNSTYADDNVAITALAQALDPDNAVYFLKINNDIFTFRNEEGKGSALMDRLYKIVRAIPDETIAAIKDKLSLGALTFFQEIGKIEEAPAEIEAEENEGEVLSREAKLPAHWNSKDWRMPTEKEFKDADKFLQHLIATPRSLETGGFSPSFLREKVDSFPDALRALYFKYPNIAASLFINITRGSHGVWGDMLTYRSKNIDEDSEKMIESTLLADMISRALDIYRKDRKVEFEDKDYQAFTQSQSLEYLGILFAYLQPARRMAIVKSFPDENLDLLLSALQKGRTNKKHYDYLTPLVAEVQKRIAEQKKEVPAYWQNDWPVPTKEQLKQADELLGDIIESQKTFNQADPTAGEVTDKGELADILTALYFKYPNITASFFMMTTQGSHGRWGNALNPGNSEGERMSREDIIKSSLLADMINRGLELYRNKDQAEPENKEFRFLLFPNGLTGLGTLFTYLRELRSVAIIKYIDDRNLDLVLLALEGAREKGKDYRTILAPIIEEVQKRISGKSTELSNSDEENESEKSIPQYVTKKIPQITGTSIGKLVVFKENPYGEKDYLAIPKGSIAAFPYLAGSWTSLRGHYNGIITYYPFIRGAHAKGRAQEDGIPGALWPGPTEELLKYNNQYVKFVVTRQGVEIAPSSEEAFKEFERDKAAREKIIPEIPMPKYSSLKNGPLFLAPGSAQMKNPEEVGYKPALLNIVAGHDLSVSDPDIKIEADGGAALPFRTFFKFTDSRSDLAPDSMKEYYDLANTISREYAGEPKEIEAKVKAMFDSMDKAQAEKFLDAIVASMKEQGQDPQEWMNNVFVRCATNIENVPDKPTLGSGIFKTVANVKGREAFLKAVFEVYFSMYSDKAYWEKEDNAIPHSDVYPGVWLLKSKPADYSLVLRWQKGEDEVDVSLAQGLGEAVMSGEGDEQGVEEAATLPTTIAFNAETAAITNDPVRSTQKMMFVLNDGQEGGTKALPVDPKKEFLDHSERDRILKALAQLRTKVEAAAEKEGILKNGFEIEAGIKFGADGKTATITLLQVIDVNKKISSAVLAQGGEHLPNHWHKSWGPVPAQKYIEAADQFFDRQLSKDSFSFSFSGISSFGGNFVLDATDYTFSDFKSSQERLDYLKACYFKYPKLTGLFFLTSASFHADWGRFLNPEFANNDENEKLIPSDMIAAMMNQALEIYMSRGETQFEKEDVQFGGGPNELQVVARFFRVFPTERKAAVLAHIKDENLSTLLSGIIDFYFNSYDMVRGQIAREIVAQIAPERLEKAAVDLTRQERIGLMEITGDRSFGVSSPVVSSSQTVLIVDNTRRWREFLVKALGNNYEIIETQNGDQALAEVEKGNIDLVVTDVDMPGMGGDKLAKALSEKLPDLPVIFHTSGYVAPEYKNLPNVKANITKNDALPSAVLEEVEKVLPKKSSSAITPGGIDFKAADSIIKTKGEGVEFALPPELQGIDLNSFQGFTPVIIHITPVTDFMGLLGLSTEDLKDEDSVLSQNAPATDSVVALKD